MAVFKKEKKEKVLTEKQVKKNLLKEEKKNAKLEKKLSKMENKKNKKKKWSTKKKVCVISLGSMFVVGVSSFLFLFYGPWAGFRNFWITSAMTTMTHQYLATWFYSDETIQKVLANNSVIEVDEVSNSDAIQFKKYTTTIYRNEYEKDVLTKDPGNDLYKVIRIQEATYNGFLVVLYDPSKIHIATTAYLGQRGEDIKKEKQSELDKIAQTTQFEHWFCGHYHCNERVMMKFDVLYENIMRVF